MEKDIKKYAETIDILRKECKQKDKEIHQAATFGQQLLNEKIEIRNELQKMQTQLEILEQEKYSLQRSLESQKQTVVSQTTELETQTKNVENLKGKVNILEKQAVHQKQRFDNLEKEKNDLERSQQDLQLENSTLKNNIKLLEKQIEALQESVGLSMNETGNLEDTNNISMYITKNKELEDTLAEVKQELHITKLSEIRLTNLVKELEEAVAERDKELSSYSVEIQREKDYSAELQCEIEVLKLDQLDPKRRGNSMFEELDDRRKLVEKEYKILSKKYDNVLRNYEENKKELTNCKGRMAILQSMTSKHYQDEYIKQLESQLSFSRKEIDNLSYKLTKVMKNQEKQNPIQTPLSGDKYDYLRVMIQQAEKKAKDAENELMTALMKIKNLNDILFESHQHMYKVKKDLSDMKTENLKLKQEIKELTFKPDSDAPVKPKPRVEIRPGFESNPKTLRLAEMALKGHYNQKRNEDIVPGVLTLGENGFVETRAPRLSTKAMLRDNLQKLYIKNSAMGKQTLDESNENTENISNENTENNSNVKKTEACASPVKPNNCAQQ